MIRLLQNSKNEYSNTWKVNILAVLLLTLASCTTTPEETIQNYLDCTFLNNKGKEAYKLLSSDDHKYKTEKEFVSEIRRKNLFNENFLKKFKDQFSYEILETTYLNHDTVIVKVILTKPNTHHLFQEMVTYAMASSYSSITSEGKDHVMKERLGKIMGELEIETEEKEYTLIKEDGSYKIYLNLGSPYKEEVLRKKLETLQIEAEERKRLIDYEGALKIYKKMFSIRKDETSEAEINEIEKIQQNTVFLGKSTDIGNLTISPKKVEVRKVELSKKNWLDNSPKNIISEEAHFVLTFQVTNNCEGEVFEFYDGNRYKKRHIVFDNYGNVMNEFSLDFDTETVEHYKHRKLSAGETIEVKAVCEAPLSKKAEKFLWKIKLYTDNKKTEDYTYVSFNRSDILFQP